MDDSDWDRLIEQLKRGDCTPFLGAGACAGTLPDAATMSREWAGRGKYPFQDDNDLSQVMHYISISDVKDPVTVKERVCADLQEADPPAFNNPGEPHALLAGFPIRVFMTTNYDDFLSKALFLAGKRPKSVICPWYFSAGEPKKMSVPAARPEVVEPLVFHLHGIYTKPNSLVLTEDDYLEFLTNIAALQGDGDARLIPSVVLDAMTTYPLLFIGYRLKDWTFRVIFHGLLRAQSDVLHRRSVSVQMLPPLNTSLRDAEKLAQAYVARYLEGWRISIFWGTAEEFCSEVRRRAGLTR